MGSVKAAKSNKLKTGQDDLQQEDVVQAVLIADSFSTRFAPITDTTPEALIPLVNRPIIDYTLEFLLLSGVQKVYVYCASHSDQTRNYLRNSKWSDHASPMNIQVLSSQECRSLGDALRDIDGKNLIRSDFVLLSANIICNMQLIPVLEKHKERKKSDKGMIMTHVFAKSFPGHQIRTLEEEFILGINPTNDQILHYQNTSALKKVNFPLEMFKENPQVELHYDLSNTHISICSPVVLNLFSDNFDYQTWEDFAKGILTNEEILGNTIYLHQLKGFYGARVSNIHMYDAISKDIINRWTYPLVPDLTSSLGNPRHALLRHNVYKQPNVTLARRSVLEMGVVVGEGSAIGESTRVNKSVIGSHCKIGDNVTITDAYIWNNVTIKSGCRIDVALLGNGVKLEEGVVLGRGCVVGSGCVVAAGTKVPDFTRLVAQPKQHDSDFEANDDEEEDVPLNPGSCAYVYRVVDEDEDSDAESLIEDMWGKQSDLDDDDDYEESVDEEEVTEDEDSVPDPAEDDTGHGADDPMSNTSLLPEDVQLFYIDVLDSLQRGYEENINWENLVLEINSAKHAYNVSMKEVNMMLTRSILSLPDSVQMNRPTGSKAYLQALTPILKFTLPLLVNYIKSEESQCECIAALENYSGDHEEFLPCVGKIFEFLYNRDILSEEVLTNWFYAQSPNPISTGVKEYATPFIKWLEEAEEESSEEESSEEEESEETD